MTGGKLWTFKGKEVAEGFDSHVRGQLPFYSMVLDSIVSMAKNFLPENGALADLGCATGNFYSRAIEMIEERNATYFGVDNSPEMLSVSSKQSASKSFCYDLNTCMDSEPFMKSDVFVLNLTYMFLNPKFRRDRLEEIMAAMPSHGAVILVDKCKEMEGYLSCVYRRMLWDFKSKASTLEEIVEKELSLRGVQIPERREVFIRMGFKEWFRYGDFSGFIYAK